MHPQNQGFWSVLGGKFCVGEEVKKNTPQIVGFYWLSPPNHGLCLVMNLVQCKKNCTQNSVKSPLSMGVHSSGEWPPHEMYTTLDRSILSTF